MHDRDSSYYLSLPSSSIFSSTASMMTAPSNSTVIATETTMSNSTTATEGDFGSSGGGVLDAPPTTINAKNLVGSETAQAPATLTEENHAKRRPPLSYFLNKSTNIPTQHAQQLLDFAIVGFAKCGTTTLGTWLMKHPQVTGPGGELYDFRRGPDRMIKNLVKYYTYEHHDVDRIRIGYRCPHDMQYPSAVLKNIATYFPSTKLIAIIRHPIEWFESFYNYRFEQHEERFVLASATNKRGSNGGELLHHPNDLIGILKECYPNPCKSPQYLSTATGAFHYYLARLGKTTMTSEDELRYLKPFLYGKDFPTHSTLQLWSAQQLEKARQSSQPLPAHVLRQNGTRATVPNPIFLIEMSQLGDRNETRASQLSRKLQRYLGLDTELPEIPHVRPEGKFKKLKDAATPASMESSPKRHYPLNICHDEYKPLRTELLHISRNASLWLREYFLPFDSQDDHEAEQRGSNLDGGVHVANVEHLRQILKNSWMNDPCAT